MFNIEDSALLVVDVQGKLAHAMYEHEALYPNMEKLIKAAEILQIPILWTEQAPDKIGSTIPRIHDLLFPIVKPIAKRTFSCWRSEDFAVALRALKRQSVVILGIETHVCIYQTAADLKAHGYHVQVVADATSARTQFNRDIAIERMRQENITITCMQSVVCEWMKTADHSKFKDIMAYIK